MNKTAPSARAWSWRRAVAGRPEAAPAIDRLGRRQRARLQGEEAGRARQGAARPVRATVLEPGLRREKVVQACALGGAHELHEAAGLQRMADAQVGAQS